LAHVFDYNGYPLGFKCMLNCSPRIILSVLMPIGM